MNDRYGRAPKGTTRKKRASANRSRAAASVHIQSSTKTLRREKRSRRLAASAERAKQNELDRKYYNPPTAEYNLRRLWWVVPIAAAIMVARRGSLVRSRISYVTWLAYVLSSLRFTFSKIRKGRRKYQMEMESQNTKESRRARRAEREAEKQKQRRAAEAA